MKFRRTDVSVIDRRVSPSLIEDRQIAGRRLHGRRARVAEALRFSSRRMTRSGGRDAILYLSA